MEIHSDSGLRIGQSDIDYERPEQVFISPGMSRLKNWLRKESFSIARTTLRFSPGIYIFSSLTCDDRDLGVYSTRYLDTVVEIRREKRIVLSRNPVTIDRRELRPLPDSMTAWLREQATVNEFDFARLVDGFVHKLAHMDLIVILSNESYNLVSTFGDTEDEFRDVCADLASVEKSEQALELATIIDREMQQNMAHLRRGVGDVQKNKREVISTQVEGYESGCKRLLNKAISMHVLEPRSIEEGASRAVNYNDALAAEVETIAAGMDRYKDEFLSFSRNLIERFGEIEQNANIKAENIGKISVPPSSCTLNVLRCAIAWLPFWNIEYTIDGEQKERLIRAF